MKTDIVIKICLTVICLLISVAEPAFPAEEGGKPSVRLKSLRLAPGFDETRIEAVGRALNFQGWPQTDVLHVAPKVIKSLISQPDLVTRESASYSYVQFDETLWGKYSLSWGSLVEKKQLLPAELPSYYKEKLLGKLSNEQRKDPDFVKEYLKRALDRYRNTQKYRLKGELNIEVCLTPSSRSAQEYMLVKIIDNMMPTEGLVNMYVRAIRPDGLGNISFLTESSTKNDIRIKLVRNNIYLEIRANGVFASEALPLARKIDMMILNQPSLTYQQLMSRKPLVSISPESQKEKTVLYDVSVAAGQKVVSVRAFVDGQDTTVKDKNIFLADKKGKVKVKVVAITQELLVNSSERELTVNK